MAQAKKTPAKKRPAVKRVTVAKAPAKPEYSQTVIMLTAAFTAFAIAFAIIAISNLAK